MRGPLLATPKPQRRVAAAQNDEIVLRFHFEFGGECMLTSHRKANIKHFLASQNFPNSL